MSPAPNSDDAKDRFVGTPRPEAAFVSVPGGPNGVPGESDESIIARVIEGETAQFEVLVRRYNERLFRVTRVILRDDMEAEDVMQEVYVQAFLHLDQFEGRARFSTWLTRIAVRAALSRRAARRRLREDPHFLGTNLERPSIMREATPDLETSRLELHTTLTRAVDSLPTSLRLVFTLREIQGLSTRETAAALDLTEENVKVRLHRARRALRRFLAKSIDRETGDLYAFHLTRCDRVVAGVFARIGQQR